MQYYFASHVAQMVKNPPAMWEMWVWSLGWKDPLEKGALLYWVGFLLYINMNQISHRYTYVPTFLNLSSTHPVSYRKFPLSVHVTHDSVDFCCYTQILFQSCRYIYGLCDVPCYSEYPLGNLQIRNSGCTVAASEASRSRETLSWLMKIIVPLPWWDFLIQMRLSSQLCRYL